MARRSVSVSTTRASRAPGLKGGRTGSGSISKTALIAPGKVANYTSGKAVGSGSAIPSMGGGGSATTAAIKRGKSTGRDHA